VILVAAGLGYYFWGRQRPVQQRHRRRSHAQTAEDEGRGLLSAMRPACTSGRSLLPGVRDAPAPVKELTASEVMPWQNQALVVIYFFYGLAFFSMGLL